MTLTDGIPVRIATSLFRTGLIGDTHASGAAFVRPSPQEAVRDFDRASAKVAHLRPNRPRLTAHTGRGSADGGWAENGLRDDVGGDREDEIGEPAA